MGKASLLMTEETLICPSFDPSRNSHRKQVHPATGPHGAQAPEMPAVLHLLADLSAMLYLWGGSFR